MVIVVMTMIFCIKMSSFPRKTLSQQLRNTMHCIQRKQMRKRFISDTTTKKATIKNNTSGIVRLLLDDIENTNGKKWRQFHHHHHHPCRPSQPPQQRHPQSTCSAYIYTYIFDIRIVSRCRDLMIYICGYTSFVSAVSETNMILSI
jgi:hypothetical protein